MNYLIQLRGFESLSIKGFFRACSISALLITQVITVPLATAQTSTQQQKVAAIIPVIQLLLLDDRLPAIPTPLGNGITLGINELSPDTYAISGSLFAEFEAQNESVELCFNLSSSTAIAPNDLIVEVNGEPQPAHLGENCFAFSYAAQRMVNFVNLIVNSPTLNISLDFLELQANSQTQLELPRISRGNWNTAAVRKVLKLFAFGGHATDTQISLWADMRPPQAIIEMLDFSEHNLKLSPLANPEPYPESASIAGTFTSFLDFISNSNSSLPIPLDKRASYGIDGYNFPQTYGRMITVRGLNPFRQRIGYWETNYHLATNRDAGVSRLQMASYYDAIMQAHESGIPYHRVIGVAAKSAAVAQQYGHRRNQWVFNRDLQEFECRCNDDFAREIHQLFYGIFGKDDPNHEDGTIGETAKMLTDMPVTDDVVTFGTEFHHTASLNIFSQPINGATASAKIDSLMPISIMHPESLDNLPIMIIAGLADDNLSPSSVAQLQNSWASMGQDKIFLDFIHAYAISKLFHGPQQFKYLNSHERALYLANKNNLTNIEAYFGGAYWNGARLGRSVGGVIRDDGAGDFFEPIHNVFGGQTSQEASDSALVFENNYNAYTDNESHMRRIVQCDACDLTNAWEKPWQDVLPTRADGQYYADDIASWLWVHAIGSLDNYTELERAHLLSLLASARYLPGSNSHQSLSFDFNLLMCVVEDYQSKVANADISLQNIMSNNVYNDYCREDDDGIDEFTAIEKAALNRVYTGADIVNNSTAQSLLTEMANTVLPLTASGESNSNYVREYAKERVNMALGFIYTTPFVFAEGQ